MGGWWRKGEEGGGRGGLLFGGVEGCSGAVRVRRGEGGGIPLREDAVGDFVRFPETDWAGGGGGSGGGGGGTGAIDRWRFGLGLAL